MTAPGKVTSSTGALSSVFLSILILIATPTASKSDQDDFPGRHLAHACLLDELCLQRIFIDVAGLSGDEQARIVKWTALIDLRYEPGDHVARREIISAIDEAHRAALASGLPRPTNKGDPKSALPFWIAFGDDMPPQTEGRTDLQTKLLTDTAKDLAAHPHRLCQGYLHFPTAGAAPVGAALRFRAGIEGDDIIDCATEMFFRLMGLHAPSGVRGFDSLLTDRRRSAVDTESRFSSFDQVLLSLLYDPAIKAGMDREAVDSIFHDIYTSMLPPRREFSEPLTAEYVDPIDQRTNECMADKACVLDHFIVMTMAGSAFEPNPNEHKNLSKLIIPAALSLVIDPSVDETTRRAAQCGYDYVMAMANRMHLPHMPVYPEDRVTHANGFVLVAPHPLDTKPVVIEGWIKQRDLDGLYDRALSFLNRYDCTAVGEFD